MEKDKILLTSLGDLTLLLRLNHSSLGKSSKWHINDCLLRTFSKAQCFVFELQEAFNDFYEVTGQSQRYLVVHSEDSIKGLFSFAVNLQFENFQESIFSEINFIALG